MKLLTTLIVLLLVAVSFSYGGDHTFFFGGRYDDGFLLSYGTAIDMGKNVWMLGYASCGRPYTDVSTEFAYIFPLKGGFSFGLLAGPDTDVLESSTYLTSASGILTTYEFGTGGTFNNVGLWAYGKYKASLAKDDLYNDGWAIGGGLYVWW